MTVYGEANAGGGRHRKASRTRAGPNRRRGDPLAASWPPARRCRLASEGERNAGPNHRRGRPGWPHDGPQARLGQQTGVQERANRPTPPPIRPARFPVLDQQPNHPSDRCPPVSPKAASPASPFRRPNRFDRATSPAKPPRPPGQAIWPARPLRRPSHFDRAALSSKPLRWPRRSSHLLTEPLPVKPPPSTDLNHLAAPTPRPAPSPSSRCATRTQQAASPGKARDQRRHRWLSGQPPPIPGAGPGPIIPAKGDKTAGQPGLWITSAPQVERKGHSCTPSPIHT
jgi:hypothetical protein